MHRYYFLPGHKQRWIAVDLGNQDGLPKFGVARGIDAGCRKQKQDCTIMDLRESQPNPVEIWSIFSQILTAHTPYIKVYSAVCIFPCRSLCCTVLIWTTLQRVSTVIMIIITPNDTWVKRYSNYTNYFRVSSGDQYAILTLQPEIVLMSEL